MVDILIGNVKLENLLIFIFIFLITAVAGNTSYALIRKLLDDRLSLRNSKFIAKVIEYLIFIAGLSYGFYYILGCPSRSTPPALGVRGAGAFRLFLRAWGTCRGQTGPGCRCISD